MIDFHGLTVVDRGLPGVARPLIYSAARARGTLAPPCRTPAATPRRDRDRRLHVGNERRSQAGRADLWQLALERPGRARLDGPARRRALAMHVAAVARRRSLDPAAQRDLWHDGDRP